MGKGIVLLWRKVGGENIPRLTGRTGCPNRNSTEEPVPEAGSRYRRGFSFVARLPRNRPGTGRAASGREPSAPCPASEDWHRGFCPSHREYGQKGTVLYRKFFSGRLPRTPALAAGAFLSGEGQPCLVQYRAFAHTPALARRDIFTGRGSRFRPVQRRALPRYPGPCPPDILTERGAALPDSAAGESALVIGSLADRGNDLLDSFDHIVESCLLLTQEQEIRKPPTWSVKRWAMKI